MELEILDLLSKEPSAAINPIAVDCLDASKTGTLLSNLPNLAGVFYVTVRRFAIPQPHYPGRLVKRKFHYPVYGVQDTPKAPITGTSEFYLTKIQKKQPHVPGEFL
uniref:Uncharacterized protein n=1 Tax=Moniliophthora roreri TaxID=221103 RepID=A0A0W0F879_MONRR